MIVDFNEAKKRRERHQLMKARYGSMMLAEMSFADEVADREEHDPSYKKLNPNRTPHNEQDA
jgi:hypothetical protein